MSKAPKFSNLNDGIEHDFKNNTENILSYLSNQELNENLEKGYADVLAGRTQPAKEVFAELRKDYDL